MSEGQLRLSDAERDAAAADLGEHFAQGRLTAEEHTERLELIWAARTRGEIAPIFSDLPSPYTAVPRPARDWRQPLADINRTRAVGASRRGVPAKLIALVALLVALTVISHLPFIVFGLFAWCFVAMRHRAWHRHGPGWR